MIVVWVNKRKWKTPGPIVNVAVHNAASFAAIGYETHLCLGRGGTSDTSEDLAEFYGIRPDPLFTVHPISRQPGMFSASLSVFGEALKLIRKLRRRDSVAVFTRESGFLAPLVWLCRQEGMAGFYELHDFYADLSWVPHKESGHYREHLYERLFLPHVSGLVCITRSQQALYRRIFPEIPSCAFPLGVQSRADAASSPDERRRKRTLMYVGRMHGAKGIDFLLNAAVRLRDSGVRVACWGGKEEYLPVLRARAGTLGLDDASIHFEPFHPPEVMHRALDQTASLGVVMLQDTFYNRYLTCPVKALDYLSHGIPAIGSDLPSVREVLADAGAYVAADDLEGFIGRVLDLLDDPVKYAEMAGRSRERGLAIAWENRARALARFAEARLQKHGG